MSKFFKPSEYACRCGCGFTEIHPATLSAADTIRSYKGKPQSISSGCRCPDHNKKVGGASASFHLPRFHDGKMVGFALDLPTDEPDDLYNFVVNNLPGISCIKYETFIHIDCRPKLYRSQAWRSTVLSIYNQPMNMRLLLSCRTATASTLGFLMMLGMRPAHDIKQSCKFIQSGHF